MLPVSEGWGSGELLVGGFQVSVWEDEEVSEMDGRDGCTTVFRITELHS